jgi:hypothetical protein
MLFGASGGAIDRSETGDLSMKTMMTFVSVAVSVLVAASAGFAQVGSASPSASSQVISQNPASPAGGPGWTDLGGGTVGVEGPPKLIGKGTLLGASHAAVRLTEAPPLAPMLVWVSLDPTPFPAIGGTVHAFPFTTQLLVFSDIKGDFHGTTIWPVGLPAGTSVWFQFILQDLTVPDGLTLSNGLRATTSS